MSWKGTPIGGRRIVKWQVKGATDEEKGGKGHHFKGPPPDFGRWSGYDGPGWQYGPWDGPGWGYKGYKGYKGYDDFPPSGYPPWWNSGPPRRRGDEAVGRQRFQPEQNFDPGAEQGSETGDKVERSAEPEETSEGPRALHEIEEDEKTICQTPWEHDASECLLDTVESDQPDVQKVAQTIELQSEDPRIRTASQNRVTCAEPEGSQLQDEALREKGGNSMDHVDGVEELEAGHGMDHVDGAEELEPGHGDEVQGFERREIDSPEGQPGPEEQSAVKGDEKYEDGAASNIDVERESECSDGGLKHEGHESTSSGPKDRETKGRWTRNVEKSGGKNDSASKGAQDKGFGKGGNKGYGKGYGKYHSKGFSKNSGMFDSTFSAKGHSMYYVKGSGGDFWKGCGKYGGKYCGGKAYDYAVMEKGYHDAGKGDPDFGKGYWFGGSGKGYGDFGKGYGDYGKGYSDWGKGAEDYGKGYSGDAGKGYGDKGKGYWDFGKGYSTYDRMYADLGKGDADLDYFGKGHGGAYDQGYIDYGKGCGDERKGYNSDFGKGYRYPDKGCSDLGKGYIDFAAYYSEYCKGYGDHGKGYSEYGKGFGEYGKACCDYGKGFGEYGKACGDYGKGFGEYGKACGDYGKGCGDYSKGFGSITNNACGDGSTGRDNGKGCGDSGKGYGDMAQGYDMGKASSVHGKGGGAGEVDLDPWSASRLQRVRLQERQQGQQQQQQQQHQQQQHQQQHQQQQEEPQEEKQQPGQRAPLLNQGAAAASEDYARDAAWQQWQAQEEEMAWRHWQGDGGAWSRSESPEHSSDGGELRAHTQAPDGRPPEEEMGKAAGPFHARHSKASDAREATRGPPHLESTARSAQKRADSSVKRPLLPPPPPPPPPPAHPLMQVQRTIMGPVLDAPPPEAVRPPPLRKMSTMGYVPPEALSVRYHETQTLMEIAGVTAACDTEGAQDNHFVPEHPVGIDHNEGVSSDTSRDGHVGVPEAFADEDENGDLDAALKNAMKANDSMTWDGGGSTPPVPTDLNTGDAPALEVGSQDAAQAGVGVSDRICAPAPVADLTSHGKEMDQRGMATDIDVSVQGASVPQQDPTEEQKEALHSQSLWSSEDVQYGVAQVTQSTKEATEVEVQVGMDATGTSLTGAYLKSPEDIAKLDPDYDNGSGLQIANAPPSQQDSQVEASVALRALDAPADASDEGVMEDLVALAMSPVGLDAPAEPNHMAGADEIKSGADFAGPMEEAVQTGMVPESSQGSRVEASAFPHKPGPDSPRAPTANSYTVGFPSDSSAGTADQDMYMVAAPVESSVEGTEAPHEPFEKAVAAPGTPDRNVNDASIGATSRSADACERGAAIHPDVEGPTAAPNTFIHYASEGASADTRTGGYAEPYAAHGEHQHHPYQGYETAAQDDMCLEPQGSSAFNENSEEHHCESVPLEVHFRSRLLRWEMTTDQKQRLQWCLAELNEMASSLGPEWGAKPFGSAANGFGMRDSDADLTIVCRRPDGLGFMAMDAKSAGYDLRWKLYPQLVEHPRFEVVNCIFNARVPLLKLRYQGALDVDLSMHNVQPFRNTRLLRAYSELGDAVRFMGGVVKIWAKAAGICGAAQGNLSSYCFTLMVIFYMQMDPLINLPVLPTQAFEDGGRGQDDPEFQKAAETWSCQLPPALLVVRFFHFFDREFDWTTEVISVRMGKHLLLWNECFELLPKMPLAPIHVEDPYEMDRDLGRALHDESGMRRLRTAFSTATHALSAGEVPVGLESVFDAGGQRPKSSGWSQTSGGHGGSATGSTASAVHSSSLSGAMKGTSQRAIGPSKGESDPEDCRTPKPRPAEAGDLGDVAHPVSVQDASSSPELTPEPAVQARMAAPVTPVAVELTESEQATTDTEWVDAQEECEPKATRPPNVEEKEASTPITNESPSIARSMRRYSFRQSPKLRLTLKLLGFLTAVVNCFAYYLWTSSAFRVSFFATLLLLITEGCQTGPYERRQRRARLGREDRTSQRAPSGGVVGNDAAGQRRSIRRRSTAASSS